MGVSTCCLPVATATHCSVVIVVLICVYMLVCCDVCANKIASPGRQNKLFASYKYLHEYQVFRGMKYSERVNT